MPAAGTRQQPAPPPPARSVSTGDLNLTPDAVLSEFGQLCLSLPAGGAVIAVRDLSGLRCTVSFGNAPAVGSRLPTDSAFTARCLETGEVVLCEDVTSDPRIPPAVAARSSFRSAITLPLRAHGSVVGLIQVFCAHPFAFAPSAIAGLDSVAKSFAALMISDACSGGPPVIGGTLERPVFLPQRNPVRQPSTPGQPRAGVKQNARHPELYRSTGFAALTQAARAIRARAASQVSTPHLPSDKPTPMRVWLITAALLVVLSLLALLVFRLTRHPSHPSPDQDASPATILLAPRPTPFGVRA